MQNEVSAQDVLSQLQSIVGEQAGQIAVLRVQLAAALKDASDDGSHPQ